VDPPIDTPPLDTVGIDKHLADRARKTAAIPEDEFEDVLAEHRDEQQVVTANTMKKLAARGKARYKHTETFPVSDAETYASMAIRQLERIRSDDPHKKREMIRVVNWIHERLKTL